MAKLKAPLFSFEARGKIADSLVYFPWKGINAVRQHVIPTNPKTADQLTQRDYLSDAVVAVHDAQAHATDPLIAADVTAYNEYARTLGAIMTWFNAAVRQFINQRVAAIFGCIYTQGLTTPGADQLAVRTFIHEDSDSVNGVTAGDFFYGTSPTALINSKAAAIAAGTAQATITGLTTGTKYYWQFRPTAHADFVGTRSGIYSGTPT